MRRRFLFVVFVLVAAPCVDLFVGAAAARARTQEATKSKQQMKAQPAQTTIKPVQPVKPVSPVKTDLRIDTRTGDIAAAGATEVMVFDLQGNGLDFGGRATIRVGGSELDTNWTRPGFADAFLVVNPGILREMGFEMHDDRGMVLDDRILVSDGLRLRSPDGHEVTISDSWDLLGHLDTNRDGKLDAGDHTWSSLALFVDANADGTMAEGELNSFEDFGIQSVSIVKSESRSDVYGNTLTDGTYLKSDGSMGALAGVKPRRY